MPEIMLYRVFDSRGGKTIEAIINQKGIKISAIAPAGKSTGTFEVCTFPLTNGKPDVNKSLSFFEKNKKKIQNAFELSKQEAFDKFLKELDGTENFSKMGGSVSIALSMLFMKYSAFKAGKDVYELFNPKPKNNDFPRALGNVLGGGLHSNNKLPIQELLVTHLDGKPIDAIEKNINVYHEMESLLKQRKMFFGKNDEGAISVNIGFRNALALIKEASRNLGYKTKIGLDVAASEFYKDGEYVFEGKTYTEDEFKEYLLDILSEFKEIVYIEDPFNEDSFEAFADLQKETDANVCGDDLYTTNVKRIKKGIKTKSTKAVLIKPNQIGTITDTYAAVKLAKENSKVPVISHRSGESSDATIAHLAVGWKIPFIKTGTVSGERLAKLNELIYIYNKVNHK